MIIFNGVRFFENWKGEIYMSGFEDGVRWSISNSEKGIKDGGIFTDGHEISGSCVDGNILLEKGGRTIIYNEDSKQWSLGKGWKGFSVMGYSDSERAILVRYLDKGTETFFKIWLKGDKGFTLESAN